MRIVVAPDSFKESMSATVAAAAMARGIRRVLPDADVDTIPLADGGEGTAATLTGALGGSLIPVAAHDALGRPITARIGFIQQQADGPATAIIDIAAAVGLELLDPAQRDVYSSTSAGVSELLTAALDLGAHRLIIGLGGSATNDAGAGMLAGLGARLLDRGGNPVEPRPTALGGVASIDLSNLDPRLTATSIELACDVTNPLLGTNGATATFGPQKGVRTEDIAALDANLTTVACALEAACGRALRDLPGSGAAGGLGAAFLALGARLRPGIDVVMEATGLATVIASADLVLTGEGSIDSQTLSGKTLAGVAKAAQAAGAPVIAFGGRVAPEADALLEHGFAAIVPITPGPSTLQEALAAGPANLERAVATTMRLLRLG